MFDGGTEGPRGSTEEGRVGALTAGEEDKCGPGGRAEGTG